MAKRSPNRVDAEVGRRIRLYRTNAGLSQSELGRKIGVTFQQVQKYEQGANRVGAGRLTDIAAALKMPVSAFFETKAIGTDAQPVFPTELLTKPHALKLLKAYAALRSDKLRRAIVRLVDLLAKHRPAPD
ncbi:MAG: helix-turn-helix transcriptional regulator [Bradyrhizobium sp.]